MASSLRRSAPSSSAPFAGLAVRTYDGETIGVHRAIVLVEGTEESKLDNLPNAQVESFVIRSNGVKCLLASSGEDAGVANLVGYAARKSLLQYTVGEETCLAHISAARSARGASGKDELTLTIDRLQKIRGKDIDEVTKALRIESAMALETRKQDLKRPSEEAVRGSPKRKLCRRLSRYPTDDH